MYTIVDLTIMNNLMIHSRNATPFGTHNNACILRNLHIQRLKTCLAKANVIRTCLYFSTVMKKLKMQLEH